MKEQLTVIIVGCGHRSRIYASYALREPKKIKIVGLVDPNENALKFTQNMFKVPDNACYKNINEVLKQGKIADCIINGTMDNIHIETSIPFLEQGYNMLLEKPITNNAEELLKLQKVVETYHNKVMICHVLRYSDFYRTAKEIVNSGRLGNIVHIETNERVGVVHNCISYVRGKWNNEQVCGSTMLLAKCCHDIDLICWFNNATKPKKISSFGSRSFILPKNAPKGAGTRCIVDCPHVDTCQYSAKLMHLKSNYLDVYPWQCTGKEPSQLTYEEKVKSLMTDNPNGECAYKANANVVDHQTVSIEFENGSTAVHSMLCGSQRAGRSLYIMCEKGEIEGWVGEGKLHVRTFAQGDVSKIDIGLDEVIDFNAKDQSEHGGHFGGDEKLSEDFVNYMLGEKPSISCTSINDSIMGHLCVYGADKSRVEERTVYLSEYYNKK